MKLPQDTPTANLRSHVVFVHSSAQVHRWKDVETLTSWTLLNLTSLRVQEINKSTIPPSLSIFYNLSEGPVAPKTNEPLIESSLMLKQGKK